ncbi:hypothetical protein IC582_025953 [Cucumis melo]
MYMVYLLVLLSADEYDEGMKIFWRSRFLSVPPFFCSESPSRHCYLIYCFRYICIVLLFVVFLKRLIYEFSLISESELQIFILFAYVGDNLNLPATLRLRMSLFIWIVNLVLIYMIRILCSKQFK